MEGETREQLRGGGGGKEEVEGQIEGDEGGREMVWLRYRRSKNEIEKPHSASM